MLFSSHMSNILAVQYSGNVAIKTRQGLTISHFPQLYLSLVSLHTASIFSYQPTMALSNYLLALIPISFPAWYLAELLESPRHWLQVLRKLPSSREAPFSSDPLVGSQLLAYVAVALFGFAATSRLVPNIKVREETRRMTELKHRMKI